MTESEKNRIRNLHRQNSVIKEEWVCKGNLTNQALTCNDDQYCINKGGPRHKHLSCHDMYPKGKGPGNGDMVSDKDLKTLIRRAFNKKSSPELREVYSEKQRRWACVQSNLPANKRQKSLSKKEAEEMCGDVNITGKKK
jgi:hypothetical protein